MTTLAKALTIAGSDSGGGAGIQADLKTFMALDVYGTSVLTAVTAQNTLGVQAVVELPPEFVAQQFDSVLSDIGAHAAKTGMLSSIPLVQVVSRKIEEHRVRQLVVDPVMVVKGGHLEQEACDLLFDGRSFRAYAAPKLATICTHGAGCTFSAAIAAGLAKGQEVAESVATAKTFVTRAIAAGIPIGQGHAPLNHRAGFVP